MTVNGRIRGCLLFLFLAGCTPAKPPGVEPDPKIHEWARLTRTGTPQEKEQSLRELEKAAATNKDAVDSLVGIYRIFDHPLRDKAGDTLVRLGPASVGELARIVGQDNDPFDDILVMLRREAAVVLGRIGPDAVEAVPQLVKAFRVRCPPAEPDKPDPKAELRADYAKEVADFRVTVANALGRIGPGATAALPLLRAAVEDKTTEESVRKAAREAVKRIESPPDRD